MPARMRFLFSIMSLTLLVLAAVPLLRELARPTDVWWTPRAALVPLAESADRVEIYARGQPLTALLHAGRVHMAGDAGSSVLGTGDMALRFNNLDRVRAAQLPVLVVAAAACGVAAVMLLLLLTGRLAYRPERGALAPYPARDAGER